MKLIGQYQKLFLIQTSEKHGFIFDAKYKIVNPKGRLAQLSKYYAWGPVEDDAETIMHYVEVALN